MQQIHTPNFLPTSAA